MIIKSNTVKKILTATVTSLSLGLGSISMADTISDFTNSWTGKSLSAQRALDVYAPMANNNIIGTHNTYNSEAYRSCNFSVGCRYLDPQQKYSIKDQLRMGARFIEIDVHYTTKMEGIFSYPKRLLMCHGVCSINDKYFTEGLNEVRDWLNSADSTGQVIILYVEDHMSGKHGDAYNQINSRFGSLIYRSGGCGSIPNTLTKADVLAAGKKVILWGDGGCRSHSDWKNTAYTGLGDIGRIWEDRTTVGGIGDIFTGGSSDYINASDVSSFFAEGANIVNLDDMVTNDGRLAAGVWSWDNNEPNNVGNEDCASQWGNGRWNDASCSNSYDFACTDGAGNWAVTGTQGVWANGAAACATLGNNFYFAVPTNSLDNQKLKVAKDAAGMSTVWLNHDDNLVEGQWRVEGRSTQF